MGTKQIKQKRIRLNSKDRTGILSLFNARGYPRGKRGQPKIQKEIIVGLVAKIKSYKKLTPYKAWIQTTKLKNFPFILELWFKNKSQQNYWFNRFNKYPESETGIRQNFWRNHLQKYFNKKK